MADANKRIRDAGIELPPPPEPMGGYVPAVVAGDLVFVSGQLPRWGDELRYTGKVDSDLDLDTARAAARLAALNAVSVLGAVTGDLDRVKRIVKLTGSVASSPGFVNQPQVINAASEVMIEVFGQAGRHARMAQGLAELPARASVAVELIAQIETEAPD